MLYRKYIKRLLDILCSALALLLLSPVILVVAVINCWILGWKSPIFSQPRPGLKEKVFKLYKFKSMTDKRGNNGELLPDAQRITPFGKFIRKTSLDELPQLWNVLKGDMSFIGPRPWLLEFLPYYYPHEHKRHDVRPGITGLAQVNGRNTLKYADRIALDVEYVNNVSFLLDLKILWETVGYVLHQSGISVIRGNVEVDLIEERGGKKQS